MQRRKFLPRVEVISTRPIIAAVGYVRGMSDGTPLLQSAVTDSARRFEAVARHRSMTRAAAELNVTIGAISRQVAAWRAMSASPCCAASAVALRRQRKERTLRRVGGRLQPDLSDSRANKDDAEFHGGHGRASAAIASLWLMKRIGDFWRAYPDITVNH